MSSGDVVELVMPYFGDPELFRRAVHSVRAQTDPAWRLHIIDDGDSDVDAETWISGLGDGRITFERNTRTLGVCGNFQRCLERATGAWVELMGCDDELLPRHVARLRQLTEEFPDAAAVHAGVRTIDAGGATRTTLVDLTKALLRPRRRLPRLLAGESVVVTLMHGNWASFPAIAWRRDALPPDGFRQDLPLTLDLDLLVRVLMSGGTLVVDDQITFSYRRHDASVSSRMAVSHVRYTEEARYLDELAARLGSIGWHRAARAARWRVTARAHRGLVVARAALAP